MNTSTFSLEEESPKLTGRCVKEGRLLRTSVPNFPEKANDSLIFERIFRKASHLSTDESDDFKEKPRNLEYL